MVVPWLETSTTGTTVVPWFYHGFTMVTMVLFYKGRLFGAKILNIVFEMELLTYDIKQYLANSTISYQYRKYTHGLNRDVMILEITKYGQDEENSGDLKAKLTHDTKNTPDGAQC